MNKKQKIMLCRIAATAVLLLALNLLPITGAVRIILYLAAYLTIGYDILRKAGNDEVIDELLSTLQKLMK